MTKLELEIQIASQILQEPALLSLLNVDLDNFSDWQATHIIRAVEQMERDGVKVTRAEVSRYADNIDRARISDIWNAAITRSNFTHHVTALSDFVKLEKLEYLKNNIQASISDRTKPDDIISSIEEYLYDLTKQTTLYAPNDLSFAIRESVTRLEERMKSPGLPGVTTGYHELNDMFGGFEPGKLYYVGARPSQGKTALMLNFANHALAANTPIGIISVESNEKELADRMLSITGAVNSMVIKRGQAKPSELQKITDAVNSLYNKPGRVYHNPYASISDVAIQARRMVRNNNAKVIFIDYIQLIDPGRERLKDMRHLQVAYISRQLKGLASSSNVAIVCLAQVGRSAENKVPTMADFAESSALEKDADVMMAIHHEERDSGDYSAIKVLKARDGVTGECPVRFIREYLRFIEE